jgi:hypothetical protein
MTGICHSEEQAWKELERILNACARQVQSREPMIKTQPLEIFGDRMGVAIPSCGSLYFFFKRRLRIKI